MIALIAELRLDAAPRLALTSAAERASLTRL
jgi:hypothetical protein